MAKKKNSSSSSGSSNSSTENTNNTQDANATATTTEQQKTATTSFRFSGESKGYQAYKPGEWQTPYEIQFSEFTITETDLRVKTASFTSPHYIDLTKGRACCWIQRKYGENFGGIILSCEFDENTGLYHYECQDWNRLLTSKVYVILAGDTKVYDIVKKLLVKCNLSTVGLKKIDEYNNIIEEIPTDDDPEEELQNSSSGSGSSNNSTSSTDDKKEKTEEEKKKEAEEKKKKEEDKKAKRNPFYKKPEGLYDKLTARDFIMALVMKPGVSIDVHMNEHGVLRFDPYKKETWNKERWYFVDTDIYEAKLKFDITDIITQVAVKHTDSLDGNATLYTSEKLIGVNLAAFFGVMGTVIDNPTKSGGGNTTSVSGDCVTFTGQPSCGCCQRKNGGVRPNYQNKVTRAYKNYCPLCGKSGTLTDTPKDPSRGRIKEGEITCEMKKGGCDADYCIWCGYDKSGSCKGPLTPCGSVSTTSSSSSSNSSTSSSSSSSKKNSNSSSTSANQSAADAPLTDLSSGSTGAVEDFAKNKMAARIAFSESIRKWFTFSFKVPGEYPKLHTNCFCMIMMSKKFVLENMPIIGRKLNGKFTRYLGYEKNRYYIEGVTVTYSESKGLYTELKLNPFASDYSTFAKTQMQAYSALQSALGGGGGVGNANGTDCNDDTGRTFKISTRGSPTAKNTAVIGNSGANYAEAAKRGLRGSMEYLKSRFVYQGYSDNHYGSQRCPQKMWAMSTIRGNCADISWLAKCILDCVGVENYIHHGNNHYYNKFKENGQWKTVDICRGNIWGVPWNGY